MNFRLESLSPHAFNWDIETGRIFIGWNAFQEVPSPRFWDKAQYASLATFDVIHLFYGVQAVTNQHVDWSLFLVWNEDTLWPTE